MIDFSYIYIYSPVTGFNMQTIICVLLSEEP